MASQQDDLISHYIDRSSIDGDTSFLLAELKKVESAFDALQAKAKLIVGSTGTKDTLQNVRAGEEAQNRLKKSTDELTLAVRAYKQIVDQAALTQAKSNALRSDAGKIAAQEKEQLRQLNAEMKNNVREQNSAKGSIEQRRAALIRLQKEYDNLSAKEREGFRGQRLQGVVSGLTQQLKDLEAATGRYQRDVGNYRKGFDGLRSSVSQLTREFPAFTNSVQTGFLALSNNIPIFFDEVSKAKNEIKALRAEGKETQGLLSRLASSFFSFQTVLSIGVTLLAVYGKEIGEFFSAMFKGTEAMDEFTSRQKAMQAVTVQSAGAYAESALKLRSLTDRIQEKNKTDVQVKALMKEVNSEYEEFGINIKSANDLEEFAIKQAPKLLKVFELKSKAAAAYSLATAAFKKAIELQNQDIQEATTFGDQLFASLQGTFSSFGTFFQQFNRNSSSPEFLAKYYMNLQKQRDDNIKKEQSAADKFLKINEDMESQMQEMITKSGLTGDDGKISAVAKKYFVDPYVTAQIEGFKKVSAAEDLELTTRLNARKEAAAIERKIIESQRDIDLQNETAKLNSIISKRGVTDIEKLNATAAFREAESQINERANNDLVETEIETNDDLMKIKQSFLGRQKDMDKQYAQDTLNALVKDETTRRDAILQSFDEQSKKRQYFISMDRDRELLELEKKFTSGKISEEEYQKARLQIESDYNRRILQEQIDFIKQLLQFKKKSGVDVLSEEAKIKELEVKLAEATSKRKKKISEDEKQELIANMNAYKEIASELVNLASGIAGAGIEKEKNAIQDQIDLVDQKKQAEIEAVERSLDSEQKKADRIAVINAKAQVQKEQLERRQRQLDQERARFEKSASIAKIVLNTAVAVTTAFAKGSFIEALAAGVAGAAQLAIALATPIPRYKHGTQNHPGGPAIVGDGGKSELVRLPTGESFITPDTTTLTTLPKGSKVIPDAAAYLNHLSRPTPLTTPPMLQDVGNTEVISALGTKLDSLNHTVRNKKELHVTGGQRAITLMHKFSSSWLKYIEDQTL